MKKIENLKIDMIAVDSNHISKLGYDEDHHVLAVQFNNNTLYYYEDVPKIQFSIMLTSASIGTYFHNNIKWKYEYIKVK
jgi:hypothetical protein